MSFRLWAALDSTPRLVSDWALVPFHARTRCVALAPPALTRTLEEFMTSRVAHEALCVADFSERADRIFDSAIDDDHHAWCG